MQCSICNEEWYQEFKINSDNTPNIKEDNQKDLLKEMNPLKINLNYQTKKSEKEKKEKRSYLLILTLIFFS